MQTENSPLKSTSRLSRPQQSHPIAVPYPSSSNDQAENKTNTSTNTHHPPCTSPLLLPLPPPLHRHLPRPQRLRQPAGKRDIPRRARRIPPAPTPTPALRTPIRRAHTDGTIPRRRHRQRQRFPASLRRRRRRRHRRRRRSLGGRGGRRGFGFTARPGEGTVGGGGDAVGTGWGRRGTWDLAECGCGEGCRVGFFEVGGWGPALGGAVFLFGEPPACVFWGGC